MRFPKPASSKYYRAAMACRRVTEVHPARRRRRDAERAGGVIYSSSAIGDDSACAAGEHLS